MSTEPRIFYLRSKVWGSDGQRRTVYLQSVSGDGLEATFGPDPRKSYVFNDHQLLEHQILHPHIKGRWVLVRNELKRRRAEGLE